MCCRIGSIQYICPELGADAVLGGLQSFQLDFPLPLRCQSWCASVGLLLSALSFVLVICIAVSGIE
jgi:hypothetical protein